MVEALVPPPLTPKELYPVAKAEGLVPMAFRKLGKKLGIVMSSETEYMWERLAIAEPVLDDILDEGLIPDAPAAYSDSVDYILGFRDDLPQAVKDSKGGWHLEAAAGGLKLLSHKQKQEIRKLSRKLAKIDAAIKRSSSATELMDLRFQEGVVVSGIYGAAISPQNRQPYPEFDRFETIVGLTAGSVNAKTAIKHLKKESGKTHQVKPNGLNRTRAFGRVVVNFARHMNSTVKEKETSTKGSV
jgi:hypothetical protein